MSDHAAERRDVRLWDDGYAVGRATALQEERKRMQAGLRVIYAVREQLGDGRDMALLRDVATALGVTLEQEGGS